LLLPLEGFDPPIEMLKLAIPVRVVSTCQCLAVGLQAVAQDMEESVDGPLADSMSLTLEFIRQLGGTLARPAQGRPGVTTARRIDQALQGTEQFGVTLYQGFPATARTP
jgi:hypothetical protein